ncbi:MAG TPA: response regulator transcription factor [Chloroflexota bacterium]|nr:response regulator transcription factor [Chloroflexota bacterium]
MTIQVEKVIPQESVSPRADLPPALTVPRTGQRGVLVAAAEPALAAGIAALFSEDPGRDLPAADFQDHIAVPGWTAPEARDARDPQVHTPHGRLTVLETVSALGAAERALAAYRPPLSVLVLDPPLLGGSTEDACARLLAAQPGTAALVLLARATPEHVRRVCRSGARGVFETTVTPADLLAALRQVDAGEMVVQPGLVRYLLGPSGGASRALPPPAQRLNARALTALQLLARGYTSKEIAPILGTTPKAVNLTIERASLRLRAATRSEAVAIAISRGLIS